MKTKARLEYSPITLTIELETANDQRLFAKLLSWRISKSCPKDIALFLDNLTDTLHRARTHQD